MPPKLLLNILSLVKPEVLQEATDASGRPMDAELTGKILDAIAAHEARNP
ncbi:MAG: hypothetical protein JSW66_19010 [Phycisphaerales bacterium]|nr:MAG: hypothetical protein JSW66_19010 [Phycisphaerales bacterium]